VTWDPLTQPVLIRIYSPTDRHNPDSESRISGVYIWRQSNLRPLSLHIDPAQGYTDGHHPLCLVVAAPITLRHAINTSDVSPKPFRPFKPDELSVPAVARKYADLMSQAAPRILSIHNPRKALEELTYEMAKALAKAAPKSPPRDQMAVSSSSKAYDTFVDCLSCLQALLNAKREHTVPTTDYISRCAMHLQREQSFVVSNLDRAIQLLIPLVDEAAMKGRQDHWQKVSELIRGATTSWAKTPVETKAFWAKVRKAMKYSSEASMPLRLGDRIATTESYTFT